VAVGDSGRLVIEIDPDLKKQLHQTLKEDGTNLKDWFLQHVSSYLEEKSQQTSLFQERDNSKRVIR
jgi:hypothetical protein